MKILRPALIVAILCCFAAGAAFADDIHVVFDPPGAVATSLNGMTNDIFSLASPIPFTWFSCTGNPDVGIFAPGLLTANNGGPETACAEFANLTGAPITQITFDFVGSMGVPGSESVSCGNLAGDPHLSTPSCGADGDGSFTITFSGGTAIPPSVPSEGLESLFFIGEDGVAADQINELSWSAQVPEPGSLTLLAAGMGLIGLCMVFVKR